MTNNSINQNESNSQTILEKFDRESVTRHPDSKFLKYLISAVAIIYSLFHIYTTFYPVPTLTLRAIHVGLGALLIFLIYPPFKSSSRRTIPWYEILFCLGSLASFIYIAFEYTAISTVRGGLQINWTWFLPLSQ